MSPPWVGGSTTLLTTSVVVLVKCRREAVHHRVVRTVRSSRTRRFEIRWAHFYAHLRVTMPRATTRLRAEVTRFIPACLRCLPLVRSALALFPFRRSLLSLQVSGSSRHARARRPSLKCVPRRN